MPVLMALGGALGKSCLLACLPRGFGGGFAACDFAIPRSHSPARELITLATQKTTMKPSRCLPSAPAPARTRATHA